MELIISDDRRISEIQDAFHAKFPFLKLEFYTVSHDGGEGSSKKALIAGHKTIGEVRKVHTSGSLHIDGHLHAGTLEKRFSDEYGLNVQVFRKKHEIWLQTILTDETSLTELNRQAEEFSRVLESAAEATPGDDRPER